MSPVPASACPGLEPLEARADRGGLLVTVGGLPDRVGNTLVADDLQHQAHRHNGQQHHQEDIQAPPSQHGTGHRQQLASRGRSTPYVAAPVPSRSRNQQIDKSANGRRHQEEATAHRRQCCSRAVFTRCPSSVTHNEAPHLTGSP